MDANDSATLPATSAQRAADDLRVAFARLRRRLKDVSSGTGLSPTQVSVLARLAKEEASTASSLAALEGVRPQSMATIIASLEDLGMVQRTPDAHDGRRQNITLTEAGGDRNSILRRERGEWLTQMMQDELSEAERATVIEAMAIIERLASA